MDGWMDGLIKHRIIACSRLETAIKLQLCYWSDYGYHGEEGQAGPIVWAVSKGRDK